MIQTKQKNSPKLSTIWQTNGTSQAKRLINLDFKNKSIKKKISSFSPKKIFSSFVCLQDQLNINNEPFFKPNTSRFRVVWIFSHFISQMSTIITLTSFKNMFKFNLFRNKLIFNKLLTSNHELQLELFSWFIGPILLKEERETIEHNLIRTQQTKESPKFVHTCFVLSLVVYSPIVTWYVPWWAAKSPNKQTKMGSQKPPQPLRRGPPL